MHLSKRYNKYSKMWEYKWKDGVVSPIIHSHISDNLIADLWYWYNETKKRAKTFYRRHD